MKEKLTVRLEQIQKTIEGKRNQLDQMNADLNVLMGHAMELNNVIGLMTIEEANADKLEELANIPDIDEDAKCEVV